MGDHGEVCEVALNGGVKDGLGPGVAEGGPVLVQQVHQLLADVSEQKRLSVKLMNAKTMQVTIISSVSDPDSLSLDPDPDPEYRSGSRSNPDPEF